MREQDSNNYGDASGRSYALPDRRKVEDHDAYFNAQFGAVPIYVEPGATGFTARKGEMLVATVSCGVLLAIYDPELNLGAMGYVMLPDALVSCFPYLSHADSSLVEKVFEPIEACIGELKRRGASKNRICIRLFGGMVCPHDEDDRGLKNTVFVQEYLFRKGLQVLNADLGGDFIRRVHFFPATGRAVRRLLRRKEDFAAMQSLEADFNKKITSGA